MLDVEAESETHRQAEQKRCLTQIGELQNSQAD